MTNPKQRGWRLLEPGVYDGGNGDLHIIAHEFLAANGFAVTSKNIETLTKALREAFREIAEVEEK